MSNVLSLFCYSKKGTSKQHRFVQSWEFRNTLNSFLPSTQQTLSDQVPNLLRSCVCCRSLPEGMPHASLSPSQHGFSGNYQAKLFQNSVGFIRGPRASLRSIEQYAVASLCSKLCQKTSHPDSAVAYTSVKRFQGLPPRKERVIWIDFIILSVFLFPPCLPS